MRLVVSVHVLIPAFSAIPVADQQPSGLAAWPKSHAMTFWTRGSGPCMGPVQDVFIGDTRFDAPKGYPRAAA